MAVHVASGARSPPPAGPAADPAPHDPGGPQSAPEPSRGLRPRFVSGSRPWRDAGARLCQYPPIRSPPPGSDEGGARGQEAAPVLQQRHHRRAHDLSPRRVLLAGLQCPHHPHDQWQAQAQPGNRGHCPQPKGLPRRRRQLPCIPHQFTHAGINDPEHLPFRINGPDRPGGSPTRCPRRRIQPGPRAVDGHASGCAPAPVRSREER